MGIASAVRFMQDALAVSLLVPAPILIAVLLVGLVVSLVQAVTQVHEMTLVFIPKILVSFMVLYVCGNWMLLTLVNYSRNVFEQIPHMTR